MPNPIMMVWNIQSLCGGKVETLWGPVTFVDPGAKVSRLKTPKSIPPVKEGLGRRCSARPSSEYRLWALIGRRQVKGTDSSATNGENIGEAIEPIVKPNLVNVI